MSRRIPALAFVIAVDVVAVIGFVLLMPYHAPSPVLGLALLASLAVMTGTSPVKVPSTKVSVSVSDAFVLTALGAFGPMPACVVGIAAALGATIGKGRSRNPVHHAFNLGNIVASGAAASAAYLMSGGIPGAPVASQVGPLFAATAVYFVSNTLAVSTVIYLDSGRGFLEMWKESAIWTAGSTFAGLTCAAGLIWIIGYIGPTGLALGVPPTWMLTMFYRTHKDRQVAAQERVSQVQEVNLVLEDKVAERTKELQHALGHLEAANSQLVNSNNQLQEANRAKSLFLANVSHELRTPLNAVIGFSELLRDPTTGNLNQDQSGFVSDIHESGEHLLRLINNILDLTKIEAGKLAAQLDEVDVARAVQEAAGMLRAQASRKQLNLEVAIAEGLDVARLDENLFRQLLINLLSNAVKFTPAEGRIWVSVRREERDLVVDVADTGIGIAAEDLERVFEEFYQVDNSYSRQYEGTGLGLALVRRMVELQNGSISATSQLGEGSTFTCRFREVLSLAERSALQSRPAAPSCEPRAPSREVVLDSREDQALDAPARECSVGAPQGSPDGTTKSAFPRAAALDEGAAIRDAPFTVVLVEDNPMNRKLARNVLRSHGYRVLEATSGEQALDIVAEASADLILMDLQLPGMDGLEVTRRLKADPYTSRVPIVALTAHALETDERMARDAGCIGFITKPIRLATFPRQVASYLARSEAPLVSTPAGC